MKVTISQLRELVREIILEQVDPGARYRSKWVITNYDDKWNQEDPRSPENDEVPHEWEDDTREFETLSMIDIKEMIRDAVQGLSKEK